MGEPIPLREESDVQKVKRLQRETSGIGLGAARQWLVDLERLQARAVEIGEMGDAVPVGVRELLTRVSIEQASTAQTLTQILGRIRG